MEKLICIFRRGVVLCALALGLTAAPANAQDMVYVSGFEDEPTAGKASHLSITFDVNALKYVGYIVTRTKPDYDEITLTVYNENQGVSAKIPKNQTKYYPNSVGDLPHRFAFYLRDTHIPTLMAGKTAVFDIGHTSHTYSLVGISADLSKMKKDLDARVAKRVADDEIRNYKPESLAAAASACNRLAGSLWDDNTFGSGIEWDDLDPALAMPPCTYAATHTATLRPQMLYQLGRAYDKSGNIVKANILLEQAVELGNYPPALNHLGNIYENGDLGSKSQSLAIQYYRRSAEAGFMQGQYNFGRLMLKMDPTSAERAAAYDSLKEAARSGCPNATVLLGQLRSKGVVLE